VAVDVEYARRGDISIAFQSLGDGPVDLIFGAGLASHLDLMWGDPGATAFLRGLGRLGRLLLFDKPGTGLSDPVVGMPTVEQRVEDYLAVMDAAGSKRAIIIGFSEASTAAMLLAATHPQRVEGLVILSGIGPRGQTSDEYLPELADYWNDVLWAPLWRACDHWGDGGFVRALSPQFRNTIVYNRLAPAVERASASPGMARALIQGAWNYDVLACLPSIRTPTVVINRAEEYIPRAIARFNAEHIEGAKLDILPGDEHFCYFGGEDIIESIERFVGGDRPRHREETRVLSTILFTDIVDSTATAQTMGDERWRSLLEHHDAVVRDEIERHDGRCVKTLGDGALARFDRPAMAVRCARKIQTRATDLGIGVRAGIHTGECELVGDDVAGLAVHLAARIAALAGAGEVFVSSTVRDLMLGSGVEFASRGVHELKGFTGAWEACAVVDDGRTDQQVVAVETGQRGAVRKSELKAIDRAVVTVAARAPRLSRVAMRAVSNVRRRTPQPGIEPPPDVTT
jgi:class 3 adenylate cyclase/pimeloyl-ACP methyl ester carboxylesterase